VGAGLGTIRQDTIATSCQELLPGIKESSHEISLGPPLLSLRCIYLDKVMRLCLSNLHTSRRPRKMQR
jgi:hypothetical protein